MRAIARVNGEVRTDTRTGAIHWSWEQMLAAAARNTPGLRAGDVIGSGTVGGGCILEHGDGRWLSPATRWSSRSRASACCGTGWLPSCGLSARRPEVDTE